VSNFSHEIAFSTTARGASRDIEVVDPESVPCRALC